MPSDLYNAAIAAFDAVLSSVGGGELVVNGAASGQGIVRYDSSPTQDSLAVRELVSGTCRVKRAEIGALQFAQPVKVGARTVFVTQHRLDPAQALLTFNFDSTAPADGGLT